ncbi:MAG: hypothetical protein D6714_11570 [Bacteroidetes bacterium]|nr:MAG: hypothetical protein D6714_11570 [Bacteroidota bacterium]
MVIKCLKTKPPCPRRRRRKTALSVVGRIPIIHLPLPAFESQTGGHFKVSPKKKHPRPPKNTFMISNPTQIKLLPN